MTNIDVEARSEYSFHVTVSEGASSSTHVVTVGPDLAGSLGGGDAARLVEASFRFLLDREPKESILGRFDLKIISRYFPEYPDRIGDYL